MLVKYIYNHLNAREFLLVNRKEEWEQLISAIENINANDFLKVSKDKVRKGEVLYNQVAINDKFKELLSAFAWSEMKRDYYVSGDIPTAKEIVKLKDPQEQKKIIEDRGLIAYPTYNQVDFVKDRIAVEVQFGKYFSVAYDLHVKHTFFFLRDEIDVGIEIIPTHAMMRRMDTGVSWFENEVANVIREGRNNPSVPIVIIGIEPESLIPAPKAEERAKAFKKKADDLRLKARNAESKANQLRDNLSVLELNLESLLTSERLAREEYEERGTQKTQVAWTRASNNLSKFKPKVEAARVKYADARQKAISLDEGASMAEDTARSASDEGARAAELKAYLAAKS